MSRREKIEADLRHAEKAMQESYGRDDVETASHHANVARELRVMLDAHVRQD